METGERGEESPERYVCAFRGRRDSYEVPLALAEADQLDQFITDFYRTATVAQLSNLLPEETRKRLESRNRSGIPADKVRCLWGTTALENARHALGVSERRTYTELDRRYSIAARDRARKMKSNLLLYHPYAWEAFTAKYSHQPRRVLFQFHPHADIEDRLLEEDRQSHSMWSGTERLQYSGKHNSRRERDHWQHADLIICASSFTKQTLIEAGAESHVCHVIPYGVAVPDLPDPNGAPEQFEVLYVGSGVRRKGLHHLLRAWDGANLPRGSRLTLVCRDLESWVEQRVSESLNVRLIRGVSAWELSQLYRTSTLLAMPSLVEGFGHVYLEALAAGCPVLGTAHTGLPDLGTEKDGIYLTAVSDIACLIANLECLSQLLTGNPQLRDRARACAKRHPLMRFRQGLIRTLQTDGSLKPSGEGGAPAANGVQACLSSQ